MIYLEIIIESIILYISITGILFLLLLKQFKDRHIIISTHLLILFMWAFYCINNSSGYEFSFQFVIEKFFKLTCVILLYFRSFEIYKEKLENDKKMRLNILNFNIEKQISTIENENKIAIEIVDDRYQKTLISKEKQLQISKKIEHFFENNKCTYLDNAFSIDVLSDQIQVPKLYLSQTFNVTMNTTFNSYLNEKRIMYACTELKKNKKISIVLLSEMCGYQSRASFYRNFKIVKGVSFVDYRKQLKSHR